MAICRLLWWEKCKHEAKWDRKQILYCLKPIRLAWLFLRKIIQNYRYKLDIQANVCLKQEVSNISQIKKKNLTNYNMRKTNISLHISKILVPYILWLNIFSLFRWQAFCHTIFNKERKKWLWISWNVFFFFLPTHKLGSQTSQSTFIMKYASGLHLGWVGTVGRMTLLHQKSLKSSQCLIKEELRNTSLENLAGNHLTWTGGSELQNAPGAKP